MITIKVFNNVSRIDLSIIQGILEDPCSADQFYHVMIFLLDYTLANYDKDEDVQELLNEVVLLVGYFSLQNKKNQNLLRKGLGPQNIISKLANLPYNYYMGNSVERDALIPTLISVVYNNKENLDILTLEMSSEILIDYLKTEINNNSHQLSNTNVMRVSPCDVDGPFYNIFKKIDDNHARSLSISSTTSSTNSIRLKPSPSHNFIFSYRFPPELWKQAL